jgi:hypothetical protein
MPCVFCFLELTPVFGKVEQLAAFTGKDIMGLPLSGPLILFELNPFSPHFHKTLFTRHHHYRRHHHHHHHHHHHGVYSTPCVKDSSGAFNPPKKDPLPNISIG